MNFKCPLITVENIEKSKNFYQHVLNQKIKFDFGENVMFEGDFSIQLKPHFADMASIKLNNIATMSNNFELYFEEENFLEFINKLRTYKDIIFIHDVKQHSWGQSVIRFYDPDMNIIEVGECMKIVVKRLLDQGFTVEQTAQKTQHPIEFVKNLK